MAINPIIALSGEVPDYQKTVDSFQKNKALKAEGELRQYQIANEKIKNMSAREQARYESVIGGAAELGTYLETGDIEGAKKWAQNRRMDLGKRIAAGEEVDTVQTDEVLAVLNSGDPEKIKQLQGQVGQLIKLGQMRGVLKSPEADGGYNLSPGQTRFDANNNPVANVPKPEGMVAVTDPETGETTYQPSRKLSATDTKEIYEASDVIQSGQGAKEALERAKSLMHGGPDGKGVKPYSGVGAGARAAIARVPVLGDMVAEPERGAATTEYSTLVTEQALGSLKAIFGGMPTEGERKILLEMQAIADYTPEEQERIINNALTAIERREKFNLGKIQAIQTGDYGALGKTGGGKAATEAPAGNSNQDDPLGLR
jgi:hypothetical protein